MFNDTILVRKSSRLSLFQFWQIKTILLDHNYSQLLYTYVLFYCTFSRVDLVNFYIGQLFHWIIFFHPKGSLIYFLHQPTSAKKWVWVWESANNRVGELLSSISQEIYSVLYFIRIIDRTYVCDISIFFI